MNVGLMNSIWGKKLFAKLYKGITKKKPEIDIHRWKIVKGDLVEVIEGPQKGQRGKVVSVIRQKNRILIDGVNMRPRIMKSPIPSMPSKKIVRACSIHYSNVMLVDPSDNKPTKVARRFLEDGSKVRVSKRTGHIIPKPDWTQFRKPRTTIVGKKDTLPSDVFKVTFPDYEKYLPFIYARENKTPEK